jgi:hypothetical protein
MSLWNESDTGITPTILAENHTMLPYFAMSMKPGTLCMIESALGKKPDLPVSRKFWISCGPLRLCPDCAKEDIAACGEAYWKRIHQLPGVAVCAMHGKPLRAFRAKSQELLPASYAITCSNYNELDFSPQCEETLMNLARESAWALANGLQFGRAGSGEAKLHRLAKEKGYMTRKSSGTWNYELLGNDIGQYWGEGFLKELFLSFKTPDFRDSRFLNVQPSHWRVLVACFLGGSMRGFAEVLLDKPESADELAAWYKGKVSELLDETHESSVSVDLLRAKVPGAFNFLGTHEPNWISSRVSSDSVRQWIPNRLAAVFEDSIAKLKKGSWRVSKRLVYEISDWKPAFYAKNSPIAAVLKQGTESQDEWINRIKSQMCAKSKPESSVLRDVSRRYLNLYERTLNG